MSQKDAIIAELQRRYPCQATPFGGLTEVAVLFGVSRERVRQIANETGMDRIHRVKVVKTCVFCDQPKMRNNNFYCEEHQTVPLVCSECGTTFRITNYEVIARSRGKYTKGQPRTGRLTDEWFCSKPCFGAYAGRTYGWGARSSSAIRV